MPSTNTLPMQCPKCDHNGGSLVVLSITVVTVKCVSCHHTWATNLESLPPDTQEKVHAALRDI
jgi:hypothetical protein